MATNKIKAIETSYKGYRFRSRLEARWAVFFDALGVAWEYEKQGYDLGLAGWYLPDFWLPDYRYWVEIKPNLDAVAIDEKKLSAFNAALNQDQDIFAEREGLSIFCGSPWADRSTFKTDYHVYLPLHSFAKSTTYHWAACPLCGRFDLYDPYWPAEGELAVFCWPCDGGGAPRIYGDDFSFFHKGGAITTRPERVYPAKLFDAYAAARGARFEHGEKPFIKLPNSYGAAPKPEADYLTGSVVQHPDYGIGTVTDKYLRGADPCIAVRFPGVGEKRFLAAQVKLKVLRR